jgi:MFS transporter, OPA family, glycerol-3-phosphate transporter
LLTSAIIAPVHPGRRAAQWSMLLSVMFCYLFFYTGRQNLGFAVKGMQEQLAYSATTIALLNSAMLLGYGAGQAINGNLADIFGARKMVACGAVLSVILNWAFSFSMEAEWAAILWGLNGLAQSAAWPAMNRLLVNWWPRQERGKAIGLYLLSAGFSSSLTFALCILLLGAFPAHDGWRWIFRLPVSLMLVGAAVFWMVARDRPQDLGFPPLPYDSQAEPPAPSTESSLARYRHVLSNRAFLLACLSIGCESLARYGLLSWVPVHFLGSNWRANPGAGWITMGLPLGMAVGALSAGLVADRWCPERRGRMVCFLMTAAAAVTLLLTLAPATGTPLAFVLLAASGFLVYAPQASYWALCPALVGRERAGTATGLMDSVAYAFAAGGQIIIGRAIDATQNTTAAFFVIGAACVVGALVILPVRK